MSKLTELARNLFKRDITRMTTGTYKIGRIDMYGEFNNKYQYTRYNRPQYFVAQQNSHGTWDIRRTVKASPIRGLHRTVKTGQSFEEAFEFMMRQELGMAVQDDKIRTYQQFAKYIQNFSGSGSHICSIAKEDQEMAVKILKKIAGIKDEQPKQQPHPPKKAGACPG